MGLTPQEEIQLVRRATAGDRAAQTELWQAYRRWVAAIVLAHRPRNIDVDDLMQDVAIKFISKLDMLRDESAFRPWMRRIVINICRGAARGQRPTLHLTESGRTSDGADDASISAPAAPTPEAPDALSERDAASMVLRQAMTLPPEYREPLLLRSLRSMSYQQIGELLDLPVTTVETRLARARRMLREEVGSHVSLAE